jgi:membrane-bound lytic murein transglycosylase D
LGLNSAFFSSETAANAPSQTEEVQLENVESEVCLDEELGALNQTGSWDEKMSSDNVAITDSTGYDFPVLYNKKVGMYLSLFQNSQREQFSRWLARSAKYRPMIEKELAEAGLPKDLLYLAMIESGYNQLACSSAKAVGLWQFMQATGEQYDLQVDKYIDERRDPLKSTRAAVTYLSDLYNEFNDWHLAVAAYNGGPGTIRNGLKMYDVDNFWDLAGKDYLSLETKRYVPKLIAALLIAKNPEKYGFTDIAYAAPLQSDTITVGPGMSLEAIALISNSTTKEIQLLNQELRLGKTPLNTAQYEVKIPKATASLATKNLSRLRSVVTVGYKTHRVARGDTLSKISSQYNVNKTTLLKVNDLRSSKLAYGRNLRIPYNTITYQLLPEGSSGAKTAYANSLVLHRIKKGETLSRIARLYNVPPHMIVTWNGLKNEHSIRAGQQLSLYIDRPGKKESKKVTMLAANTNIRSISPRAHKNLLPQPGPDGPFARYNVQDGDSLWTISRKFSASTAEIKKWNNLTSDLIQPGSILKLKKV